MGVHGMVSEPLRCAAVGAVLWALRRAVACDLLVPTHELSTLASCLSLS